MPCSRRAGISWPSRNAPCSVNASRVPSPSLELHCGDGDRDADPVQEHVVRVDDASAQDDVPVERLEGVFPAVRQHPSAALPSADAEVELELRLRTVEPARLSLRVGPGGEYSLGGGVVDALHDEC